MWWKKGKSKDNHEFNMKLPFHDYEIKYPDRNSTWIVAYDTWDPFQRDDPESFAYLLNMFKKKYGGEVKKNNHNQYIVTKLPVNMTFQWDTMFGNIIIASSLEQVNNVIRVFQEVLADNQWNLIIHWHAGGELCLGSDCLCEKSWNISKSGLVEIVETRTISKATKEKECFLDIPKMIKLDMLLQNDFLHAHGCNDMDLDWWDISFYGWKGELIHNFKGIIPEENAIISTSNNHYAAEIYNALREITLIASGEI